jgi:MFS family permease
VAVSALLLAGTVPSLLGPLAGALVDRVEQRRLMLGAQAGQALLYGAMAAVLPPLSVLLVLVGCSPGWRPSLAWPRWRRRLFRGVGRGPVDA